MRRQAVRARRWAPLAAFVVALGVAVAPAAAVQPATVKENPSLASAIVDRVNAVRKAHGLSKLSRAAGLEAGARKHATSMGRLGYFSHSEPDAGDESTRLLSVYGPARPGWAVGEALYWQVGKAKAASVVAAWLRSPTHRRILLSPGWDDIGLAAVHANGSGGDYSGRPVTIVVADFGSRS